MSLSLEDTSFAKFFREEGEERKAKEIALKLFLRGFSDDEVAADTGLPIEEVTKLRKSSEK